MTTKKEAAQQAVSSINKPEIFELQLQTIYARENPTAIEEFFASPGKTFEELEPIIKSGISLMVEGLFQNADTFSDSPLDTPELDPEKVLAEVDRIYEEIAANV